MIDLDAEVFAEKVIVALVFKINSGSIHTAIVLMNQNITILFQIIVLAFKI